MIFKLLKVSLIGIIWSYIYLWAVQALFVNFWHFDFLAKTDWQKISWFWNGGGTIRSSKDYLFLFSLLMIIPFWLIGWKIFYNFRYLEFFLAPLILYNRYIVRKYGQNSQRIILRNIGSGKKVEQEIKEKTAAVKPKEWHEADRIREAVQHKLLTRKNKQ